MHYQNLLKLLSKQFSTLSVLHQKDLWITLFWKAHFSTDLFIFGKTNFFQGFPLFFFSFNSVSSIRNSQQNRAQQGSESDILLWNLISSTYQWFCSLCVIVYYKKIKKEFFCSFCLYWMFRKVAFLPFMGGTLWWHHLYES